jgi:hypothetical protein
VSCQAFAFKFNVFLYRYAAGSVVNWYKTLCGGGEAGLYKLNAADP